MSPKPNPPASAARLAAAGVLTVAVALPGCDYIHDRLQSCHDAQIDLVNSQQTLGPIAIAGPDEDFTPETLLESGASRRIILCLERGDRKRFRAARRNDVIGVVTCVAGKASYEGSVAKVVWGVIGFDCVDW